MNKSRNKGVSFVELAIAVVIFGLLIVPITGQLIQAMKTSKKSKEAQTKYELAENLMENVKNSGNYFFTDTVKNDTYLNQISEGTAGSKVIKYPDTGMAEASIGTEKYQGFVLTGKTLIGSGDDKTKKTDCYYAIHVNNKRYAEKKHAESATYENPNSMTLPTVESLDDSKVALIDGTIGNYDLTVTNAFMSKKLDILKVGDRARWEQYTKQQAAIVAFPNDTVSRVIEISVTDENVGGVTKYTVTCKLRYKENSTVVLKDGAYKGKNLSSYLQPIEYVPWERTYEGELPNIYLMYNPCLYNSNYMDVDHILLDTSKLTTKPDVNLFVVETAEQYSSDTVDGLIEVYKETYKEEHNRMPSDDEISQIRQQYEKQYLFNNKTIRDRANAKINIMEKGSSEAKKRIKVYHNFDKEPTEGDPGNTGNNKKTTRGKINVSSSVDISMTGGYSLVADDRLLPLSDAVSAAMPLYDVDIYVSETPFSYTSYDAFVAGFGSIKPIISGSKGGN